MLPADADSVFSDLHPAEGVVARTRHSVNVRVTAWALHCRIWKPQISWNGGNAILPVVFEDKHLFPAVESRSREDEQSLIAWFLGLQAGRREWKTAASATVSIRSRVTASPRRQPGTFLATSCAISSTHFRAFAIAWRMPA